MGRTEVPVEVRGVHVAIGAPLAHGGRLAGNREAEDAVLLPAGDRLDEAAGSEIAVADGAHPAPLDPGAQRCRDPQAEHPFGRRRQLGEGHDTAPHDLRRRRDLDYRHHLARRRGGARLNGDDQQRQNRRHARVRGRLLPSHRDGAAQDTAQQGHWRRERQRHKEAHASLGGEEQEAQRRQGEGKQDNDRGVAFGTGLRAVVDVRGDRADGERCPQEQPDGVFLLEVDAEQHGRDGQAEGHGDTEEGAPPSRAEHRRPLRPPPHVTGGGR